ncbi:MAG TPA: enolase C-terminal domain-like protein, partial [Candidatus Acidoferrum sp.]|nr:enolase C-terminal domain-like protein [Candidatus Acidoferrum sp.]
PISVPLTDVLWTAHEELKSSSVIVVEVRTDDGLTGYGQIHGSPMKTICAWVIRFGEIVRGMDALAHVAVWDRLFSLTCPRPGGIGGADGLPPPLPRGERPQIMAGSPADEAKRVRTVREAIGKDISLMLDMNPPYDVEGCIEFARRVEPLDIYWLEEPLHWYLQPADFVRLAAATSIPLAHGERELTRFTVRDFIATGAIRYVQFDSTRAAGFTEGLRVGGAETRDSFVHLNDKPGFGVEINWDYAKRYAA